MGYVTAVRQLALCFWRKFRRAEFADDRHTGAGSNAVSPSVNHGIGIGGSADSARSLYASLGANNATHERNVFRGGRSKEPRGSLNEVCLTGEAELAAQDFFFQS